MFNEIYRITSAIISAIFFVMYLFGKDREKKMEHLLVAIFCMTAGQF